MVRMVDEKKLVEAVDQIRFYHPSDAMFKGSVLAFIDELAVEVPNTPDVPNEERGCTTYGVEWARRNLQLAHDAVRAAQNKLDELQAQGDVTPDPPTKETTDANDG